MVGDSFVESSSSPLVAALEAAQPRLRVRALGRRGWSVRRHLAHVDETRRELAGVRVVLAAHFGGNDTLVTAEDVRELDRVYREDGREVLWIAPPLWPARTPVTGRRDTMRRVLRRAGVCLAGWDVRLDAGDLAGDGVHLTRAGAVRWVEQLRLEAAGCSRSSAWIPAAALVLAALLL